MRRRQLIVLVVIAAAGLVSALIVVATRPGDGDGGRSDQATRTTTTPAGSASTTARASEPEDSPARQAAPEVPPWRADSTATALAALSCLARGETTVVNGAQTTPLGGDPAGIAVPGGSVVDLRGASWEMQPGRLVSGPADPDASYSAELGESEPHHWAGGLRNGVKVVAAADASSDDLCVLGGRVWSRIPDRSAPDDPATSYNDTHWNPWGWELLWHRSSAIVIHTPNALVVSSEIARFGDGIDFEGAAAGPWRVQGARLSEIHDDCIEADEHTSGRIDDSLLDGCYAAIASRSASVAGRGDGTITVSNSLIRLQPMQTPYKPVKYGVPSNGQFFKWDPVGSNGVSDSPAVVIENSVFMAEQGPRGGSLDLPPGASCSGATLVWTGSTPVDHLSERVQRCFDDDGDAPLGERIVTDPAYWHDAVDAWEAARAD